MTQRIKGIEPAPPPPADWVVLEKNGGAQTVHPEAVPYWEGRDWKPASAPAAATTTSKEA